MDTQRRSSRKWVVYAASCLVPLLDFALAITFGSMFVHLLDRYGENRATTATVHSILLGTTTMASVVSGILIRHIGVARVSFIGSALLSGGFIASYFATSILLLDVFIGVMGGLGLSFMHVSASVVSRNCFDGPARDIALSANTFCVGIGSLLYTYFYKLLLSAYTVNETFLILGGVFLNNFAIALTFLFHEKMEHYNSMEQSEKVDKNVCSTQVRENGTARDSFKFFRLHLALKRIWMSFLTIMHFRVALVIFGTGLTMAFQNGYLVVFNDIYVWKHFSKDDSFMLFLICNTFSASSRVSPIIASKLKPGYNLLILLTVFALFGTVGLLCILFSSQLAVAIFGNILIGMTQGGVISAATVSLAKLTTKDSFSVAYGLLFTLIGLLTILNGTIYGYIRDSVKSYELTLILTAAMNGVGACLFLISPAYERRRQTRTIIVAVSEQPQSSVTESDGNDGPAFRNRAFVID